MRSFAEAQDDTVNIVILTETGMSCIRAMHDCRDAGGRAKQERSNCRGGRISATKPLNSSFYVHDKLKFLSQVQVKYYY